MRHDISDKEFYEGMRQFILKCDAAIIRLENENADIKNKCARLEQKNADIEKLYAELESKYDKLLNIVYDTDHGNYGVEGWSTKCMANQYVCMAL